MIIKFRNGHKVKFKKFGKIWLADSVISEETELYGSMDDLRVLKAIVAEWFDKNAPKEIADKFTARLPLWKEIENLPFKDQIAYRKGKTDQIANYFLGDDYYDRPVSCSVGGSHDYFGTLYRNAYRDCHSASAVRLCLEEKE